MKNRSCRRRPHTPILRRPRDAAGRFIRIAGILALALLAVACSGAESNIKQYSQVNSERMLKTGLTDIQEIFIEESSLPDLAVAGLQGLRSIEPGMEVVRRNGHLAIRLKSGVIGEAISPDEHDSRAWATTLSKLLDDSRKVSVKLQKADTEQIYTAMFEGLAAKLDRYSRYAGALEANENRASRDGFGGIGVTIILQDDGVEITKIVSGMPAEKAGLQRGDRILAIDGHDITNLDLQKIARLLRGPVGQHVQLNVQRSAKSPPVQLSIRRTLVTPETVFYRSDGDIAVIEISSFNSDTTASVAQAVYQAREDMGEALRGFILDLRDNPGGLLDQAVRIADLFIHRGIIITTRGRHIESMQFFEATPGDIAEGLPIGVLINGSSASAAEILASSLQDNGRAVLIGSRSYGKGTVQTVLRMPNGGELILTWARLHAPSGYNLNGVGIVPNVCTTGDEAPQDIVTRVLADQNSQWRSMLQIRRNYDRASAKERNTLKDYCPEPAENRESIDMKVAKLLLSVQKRYAQAIHSARATHGL
jgi:carboxyl-terminal processing protease